MAETTPTAQAYFTSSYVFGNGTTSTIALMVWRAVSETLAIHHKPMAGADLVAATGITPEQLENMFGQSYYQKFYGFRRFANLAEWEKWAREKGFLFIPGVHDVPPAPEPDYADEEYEDEDEEEENEVEV
jgi:hypothetical protein